jgi:hypothetical protein
MYYADALGFAFIDSTGEGKNNERVSFNQYQVLDMSLGQYMAAQIQLLEAIKTEWEELLGVSRQRKGQIMASDGAGTTKNAIAQSTAITEEIFRKYEKFEQKEMQGLLDMSKHAFRNGKKVHYITDDYRNSWLDIEGSSYQESEFGIFAKNSSQENKKMEQMRGLLQAMAQNGVGVSSIAEILDADNFSRIRVLAKEVEKKQSEMAKMAQEKEQKKNEAQLQLQLKSMQAQHAHDAEQKGLDRQTKLEVAHIAARSKDTDHDNDGKTDNK